MITPAKANGSVPVLARWLFADEVVELFGSRLPFPGPGLSNDGVEALRRGVGQFAVGFQRLQPFLDLADQFGATRRDGRIQRVNSCKRLFGVDDWRPSAADAHRGDAQ